MRLNDFSRKAANTATASIFLRVFNCTSQQCPSPVVLGSITFLNYFNVSRAIDSLIQENSTCDVHITFPDHTSIEKGANSKEIDLSFKDYHRNTTSADWFYLITSVDKIRSTKRILLGSKSLPDFLNKLLIANGENFRKIKSPTNEDWFGGNLNAKNNFASGSFNYTVIEQLHSDDLAQKAMRSWRSHPKWRTSPDPLSHIDSRIRGQFNVNSGTVRGLECHVATAMHLFKSLGLVRSDMNRPFLEHAYTELHNQSGKRGIIPGRFNRTLQGYYDSSIAPALIAEMANLLSESSWAAITGASQYRYTFIEMRSLDELTNKTDNGGVVYAWLSVVGGYSGHSYLITYTDGESLRVDESFEWQPAKKVKWKNYGYSRMISLSRIAR